MKLHEAHRWQGVQAVSHKEPKIVGGVSFVSIAAFSATLENSTQPNCLDTLTY